MKEASPFLLGIAYEKARLAEAILASPLSSLPDNILAETQEDLKAGSRAVRAIQNLAREAFAEHQDRREKTDP